MSQLALQSFDDLARAAEAVAASKLFGVTTPEQAIALFLVAQSEGRHPASAAKEYHIIKGRPSLRSDAILARFQTAGGSVRWGERTDASVSATFSHPQGGDVEVRWTLEDAKRAGLAGGESWKKYPRHLLSARVISEGVRLCYAPVVAGVYTPEEVEQFDAPIPAAPVQAAKPVFAKPIISKPAPAALPALPVVEALAEPASAQAAGKVTIPSPDQDIRGSLLVERLYSLCDQRGISDDDVWAFLRHKGAVKNEAYLQDFSAKLLARLIDQIDAVVAFAKGGGQ
jgi:hypothetical protein